MEAPDKGRETAKKVHAEDIIFKAAGEYFGQTAMGLFGISERMRRIAPTENIRLDIRRMYEDFNMEMENGEWYHFEFESDRIRKEDLRRFREYEAATGNIHQVDVVTYVVCTADTKVMMTGYHTGINTYRVRIIRFDRRSADRLFERLEKKRETKEAIGRQELFPVVFSLLMSGKMPFTERVRKGFAYLSMPSGGIGDEERRKMQAMLYMLGAKFLGKNELEEIREEIGMTALGQMLVEDGIRKGMQEGIQQGIQQGILLTQKMIQDGRTGELELAARDDIVRGKLCQEYGLTDKVDPGKGRER